MEMPVGQIPGASLMGAGASSKKGSVRYINTIAGVLFQILYITRQLREAFGKPWKCFKRLQVSC
jgi:hypothetical protein